MLTFHESWITFFFHFFQLFSSHVFHSRNLPGCSLTFLGLPKGFYKLSRPSLDIFEKSRNFMKISLFMGHEKNLSSKRDFSLANLRTQRMHSWIGLDLTKAGKLLRSQTNSWKMSNLHFSDPFTHIFDKPI